MSDRYDPVLSHGLRPAPYVGPVIELSDVLERIEEREPWRREAECVGADPEIFFTERGVGYKDAAEHCARCPVIDECLEAELAYGSSAQMGYRGGMNAQARQALIRKRGLSKRGAKATAVPRVLALMEAGLELTVTELTDRTGLTERSVRRALAELHPGRVRTRNAYRGQVWFKKDDRRAS